MKKNHTTKGTLPMWIIVSAVIIGILALYYVNSPTSAQVPLAASSSTKFEAPQFSLPDIDGRPLTLSDYRGKVVILDFWAPWCPPCKREIPDFVSLQNQYGSKGLQVVGIGLDQFDNVASFVRHNGINYPVAVGDDGIANLYGGITGIPTTYIIDREGNIVRRYEGFTERTVFEQAIKSLL